ncbi:hypothetical protein ACFU5O_26050 [Streptomyces sp. NPDC057445]|uniref:hypothetical protein n=1 Tax=Streptomyces sp. NPDC057445 TaxID=3346136 RepID=UPI0036A56643
MRSSWTTTRVQSVQDFGSAYERAVTEVIASFDDLLRGSTRGGGAGRRLRAARRHLPS